MTLSLPWLCAAALLCPSEDPSPATDARAPASCRMIDVTGDGLLDRLELAADGSLHVAVNLGGRVFDPIAQELPSTSVADILVGDLDDDGLIDLYLVSPQDNLALTGDGTGRFVDATERLGLADGDSGVRAQRLDMDGDGYADLLLRNASDDVVFWKLPGAGFERSAETPRRPVAAEGADKPGGQGGADAGGPRATGPAADESTGSAAPRSGVKSPASTGSAPTLGSGGPGTPMAGTRVTGPRHHTGSAGLAPIVPTLPPSLVAVLDTRYVNDDTGEVDGADIVDGVLNGADVSTTAGNVTHVGGFVGVGTTTPDSLLVIGTGPNSEDERLLAFSEGGGSSGFWFESGFAPLGVDNRLHVSSPYQSDIMTFEAGGNVGIQASNPDSRLMIGTPQGADGVRMLGFSEGGASSGFWFESGFSPSGGDNKILLTAGGTEPIMTYKADGNVGVRHADPDCRLTIDAPASMDGVRMLGFSEGGGSSGFWFESGFGAVGGNKRIYLRNGLSQPAMTWKADGKVGIGTTSPGSMLEVVGAARVHTLTITGGADMVERFESSCGPLEPGTVVVIDPENAGQLACSFEAYDSKVAGVVSGAGGVQPGLCLTQDGTLDGDTPVAMTGRVYVKCSTENGAIRPGDRLTTAALAGHAMKVMDASLADGAVLGKAMSSLDEGTGLVLVLVNLQ